MRFALTCCKSMADYEGIPFFWLKVVSHGPACLYKVQYPCFVPTANKILEAIQSKTKTGFTLKIDAADSRGPGRLFTISEQIKTEFLPKFGPETEPKTHMTPLQSTPKPSPSRAGHNLLALV